jgi:ABC-2 type transport system permease protein
MEKTAGKTKSSFGEKAKKFAQWWFTSEKPDEYQLSNRTGLIALYRKELRDHFRSARFIIILVLTAIIAGLSIWIAATNFKSAVEQEGAKFLFLKFFTSGDAPNFIWFISVLGPLIGMTLGFDAINSERSRGTLNRLVAQPIYRDSVINGKFLAGVTVITVMVLSLGMVLTGVELLMFGVPPSLEEIIRLLVFLLFTVVYMALWLGISILFSLLFRHAATSALCVIAIWLFFAIFLGLIVNNMVPANDNMTFDQAVQQSSTQLTLNRLSPSYLYTEAITGIMKPGTRTLSVLGSLQLAYTEQFAVDGPLPLGQSLILVWPHLTGLVALMLIFFAISYVVFMRQEIRAG